MPSEFVKEVADVFAKDGPLSKVTANYTPRPSQIEFATSVAEALEKGKTLVAEAGTRHRQDVCLSCSCAPERSESPDFYCRKDAAGSAFYEGHSGAFKSPRHGLPCCTPQRTFQLHLQAAFRTCASGRFLRC